MMGGPFPKLILLDAKVAVAVTLLKGELPQGNAKKKKAFARRWTQMDADDESACSRISVRKTFERKVAKSQRRNAASRMSRRPGMRLEELKHRLLNAERTS